MAHTPGPWGYDGTGCVYSDALPKDDCVIAELLYADGDWEADGRLMAAAPELLRLLREGSSVVSSLEADCDEAGIDSQRARWWWQSVDKLFDKLEVD